jgi:hypothetical protein
MITLEGNCLNFRFAEVHEDAGCGISFQRTLRIPDDENDYPLPPGLGRFPLRHLDDFAKRVPETWVKRGGVTMPMHQAEAMWLLFGGTYGRYPCAVKVATGKIDAVTGKAWVEQLNSDPQDYLVVPEQPWLDGYCVEKGVIRQFVAMPLGDGYSAEEQITGKAEHGGLQILVYPMKAERYEEMRKAFRTIHSAFEMLGEFEGRALSDGSEDMGLAPGGRMRQEIYDDPYGLDAWDQNHFSRCFVTIANSAVWTAITGERPPTTPPAAADYTRAGLPWFDYYGGDATALGGAEVLAKLKTVSETGTQKGEVPLPENEPVDVERIVSLRRRPSHVVREAEI